MCTLLTEATEATEAIDQWNAITLSDSNFPTQNKRGEGGFVFDLAMLGKGGVNEEGVIKRKGVNEEGISASEGGDGDRDGMVSVRGEREGVLVLRNDTGSIKKTFVSLFDSKFEVVSCGKGVIFQVGGYKWWLYVLCDL